jgi:hypothetical protein
LQFGLLRNYFSNSACHTKNRLFCSITHAEDKCDARSSDEKRSKLNAESNGTTFIRFNQQKKERFTMPKKNSVSFWETRAILLGSSRSKILLAFLLAH